MTPAQLSAYLDRIGLSAAPAATPAGVEQLVAAHRQGITFENFDVLLGSGVKVDSDSVFTKLVTDRRGGYCFEQNRLLADALAALGLANRPLLARVRLGVDPAITPPRTHVLLLVELGGEPWIADAGFGGTFVPPLPLRDGAQVRTADGAVHRVTRRDQHDPFAGEWLLERAGPFAATDGRGSAEAVWQAQYSFDLTPVAPDDIELANHWTSTRPGTRFTTLRIVSRVLPAGFAALTDRNLSVYADGEAQARELADLEEYAATLRNVFALELTADQLARISPF